MQPKTASTAWLADDFDMPVLSATAAARSPLFILSSPLVIRIRSRRAPGASGLTHLQSPDFRDLQQKKVAPKGRPSFFHRGGQCATIAAPASSSLAAGLTDS